MKKILLLLVLLAGLGVVGYVLFASGDENSAEGIIERLSDIVESDADDETMQTAFFYQYVGAIKKDVGENGVSLGLTTDGKIVNSTGLNVLDWPVYFNREETADDSNASQSYGDPVYSLLSNGNWAITSWSAGADPRGAGFLLYHESTCPTVDDDAVVAIGPSSESDCQDVRSLTIGKTSQIFDVDGENYVFHSTGGDIFLARITDGNKTTSDLASMCVLENPVSEFSDLGYGESTQVLDGSDNGLLFSDTAIAQRTDGTWVLFVKGVAPDPSCKQGALCELCGRSIYRTTSEDLISWSALEEVVEEASVPEAYTNVDGTVWLYHQDFSDACAADDINLALIAPIAGRYEEEETFDLSDPIRVEFPDEAFQTNSKMHYATNGNPVTLPDEEAIEALEACIE